MGSVAAELAGRLAGGEVIVIDGGTGTALQAAGVPMDDEAWSGRASLEHADLVQSVHEAYVRAGAEVIIANTFATSRAALAPARLGDRVAEANRNAVGAALRARAAAAGRPVAVAGSMSPFCPIAMHGRGTDAAASAADPVAEDPRYPTAADFEEQAALLADAGVDLIALEMIRSPGYGRAAIDAAAATGLPVWLGLSPIRRPDGSLGNDPAPGRADSLDDLVRMLASPALAAVTVMHAKPEVTADAIGVIRRHFDGPVGVYAESGDWTPPLWVFSDLDPQQYLREATGWAAAGAQLIGGCCGIGPDHIKMLADSLPRRVG